MRQLIFIGILIIALVVLIFVLNYKSVEDIGNELEKSKATRKIQLYYYNQKRDKEIADYIPCSPEAVLPVYREIFLSQTPVQDTINLLLQGNITQEEKEAGFSPIFPLEGVKLVGANLKNGTLTLEFEDPFNKTGGGSCMVSLLWAQIEKTAKQFSEIDEVKFTPEWLFQP